MSKQRKPPLDREEYLDERRELYRYQQAAYDGFEKTLTTLAAAFLAFSVAFLGFLDKARVANQPVVVASSWSLLIGSWVAFCLSLVLLLLVFFVNARAFTVEIVKLEDALDDASALERSNTWQAASVLLYAISTVAFFVGLVLLLLFCRRNFAL